MNGISNITREQYDRVTRVNWSTLKLMGKSPAHYRERLEHPPGPDSDAMAQGRVTHLAAFEPERLGDVAIWEEGARRGKQWEAFCADNRGREIVTRATYDNALAIGRAARTNPMAARFLSGGKGEVTVQWTVKVPAVGALEGYEVDCKGRLDFVANCGALVDLKTTRDASPEAFGRQCFNLEYHAQCAFYADGYEAATGQALPFVVVAVETSAPYVVQVYEVPFEILELGRERYRALLDTLNHCRTHSEWPGYATTPMQLTLPKWAVSNDDEDAADLGLVING